MTAITMTKEAAVAVRDALAALITNEKGRQDKTAADTQAQTEAANKAKAEATKLADHMLAKGLITKEGYDKTVENLSAPVTALPYLKKALDLFEAAKDQAKTASDEQDAPRAIGRRVPKTGSTIETGAQRLEAAAQRFDQAIGL